MRMMFGFCGAATTGEHSAAQKSESRNRLNRFICLKGWDTGLTVPLCVTGQSRVHLKLQEGTIFPIAWPQSLQSRLR